MVAKKLFMLILLGFTLQHTAASALQADTLIPVEAKTYTQAFDSRSVSCEISTGIQNGLTPGTTGNIVIGFSSAVSGSLAQENAQAVVLNGLVAIAFPPGLELAGDSKMQFFNPATGQYELMYSGIYPSNSLTTGLTQAMTDASASNPRQIISGLNEICEQLAPGSGFSSPRDQRIGGGDPAYSVAGKSWLIPVSMIQNEVVNPFNLADSMASEARLRISFPFRVTGDIAGMPVVVYAGGLCTGAAQVELLPADIPPRALPLVPVPSPVDGEVEPQLIPTLVYSSKWVTWETEFVLGDYISSQASLSDGERFSFPGQADIEQTAVEPPKPVEAQPVIAPPAQPEAKPVPPPITVPPVDKQIVPDESFHVPFIGLDSGEKPTAQPQPEPEPEPEPVTPPVVEPAHVPPVVQPEPQPQPVQPAVPAPPVPVAPEGVQEVELGTIPEQDSEYRVPLKQITGSAQAMVQPMQQPGVDSDLGGGPAFLDEIVLIEEGYFLMGTSNLSSAGDQDELPQTSVFLPDFYIDKYPVTNRKFYEFVIDAGYKPQGKWDKYYSKGTADLPVRGVTWNDANAYAKWAGKRLPTEAEWEKAARGVDGRLYPWGDNWSSDILPRGELIYDIMHAESAASPYGVMSMVGVFWQWTSSQFAVYPYDPNAVSDEYVLRGGCFSNGRNIVRCANRYSQPANVALNTFAFRCASDPQ